MALHVCIAAMALKLLLLAIYQKYATQWYLLYTLLDDWLQNLVVSDVLALHFQPEYTYVDGDGTVPAESAKVKISLSIA